MPGATSRFAMATGLAGAFALFAQPCAAQDEAEPAFDLGAEVTVDFVAITSGGSDDAVRALSNISLFASADLDRLAGISGVRGHLHVLDNRGDRPNDASGSLQGINNIEVPSAGTRLFEAWLEKDLGGGATLLAGLYDVNSEFYANDAADLLLSPPFGIGSEFAATGPNGPSIFPSSALAARLFVPLAGDSAYLRVALINAHASTLGDGGGIDLDFDDGLLAVGEAGFEEGNFRASIGGWFYTKRQGDIFLTDLAGDPLLRRSRGGFAVAEWAVPLGATRTWTWFARGGISEGRTSPFSGGIQAGFKLEPLFAGRPDGALSVGYQLANTGQSQHAALIADGIPDPQDEHAFSATYADQISPWLSLQGEVQWLRHAGGDNRTPDQIVTTLRIVLAL